MYVYIYLYFDTICKSNQCSLLRRLRLVWLNFKLNHKRITAIPSFCVDIHQTYYSLMMILNIKCILHYKLVNLFCIYYFVNARCQFDFIFVSNVKQNIRLTTGRWCLARRLFCGYIHCGGCLPAGLMIARWRSRHKMEFNSVIWHRDFIYMQVLMDVNNICVWAVLNDVNELQNDGSTILWSSAIILCNPSFFLLN